jgi:hypothetical protein
MHHGKINDGGGKKAKSDALAGVGVGVVVAGVDRCG